MEDVTGSVQHVTEASKCAICNKNMYSYQNTELVTASTYVMAAHSDCVTGQMEPVEHDEEGEEEEE